MNEESAMAFCRAVQEQCSGFAVSADVIAEYIEHDPSLKPDPRLVAEQLGALVIGELNRIARVLRCDAARASSFCARVQNAFPGKTISLKSIADWVERNSFQDITAQLVIRAMGGPPELTDSDYDPPERGKKRRRRSRGLGVTRANESIEAIKRRTGDWETD